MKQPIFIKILQHIFAHPLLAALIVGSLIHAGKWLNFSIHDNDYFSSIHFQLENGLSFLIIDALIPFAIPFMVITISRKLANIKEKEFIDDFPDNNPDIIIKCDSTCKPMFINNSAKELMQKLDIPSSQLHVIIPSNLKQTHNSTLHTPTCVIHTIKDVEIEFLIKKTNNNELFLSGRMRKKT